MPRIAVLGWGSLVWRSGTLAIEGEWHTDGPSLPIEFARISSGSRLTLVIDRGAALVPTLWAMMRFSGLGRAREDLRVRECTPSIDRIGWVCRDPSIYGDPHYPYAKTVKEWMKPRGIDCVIWTALESNFEDEYGVNFTLPGALAHLQRLKGQEKDDAEEYIRRTHRQVRTKLRSLVEKTLGWYAIEGER